MGTSNHRIKEHDTVHHLVSRVAHRVYILKEDERSDFLEYVRRVTEFSGLTLIGWCVMTNHFHLLVYLPVRAEVGEEEALRRYAALKGKSRAEALRQRFAAWRTQGEPGERQVTDALQRLRRRMYDVGEYMRMIKQWFTEEYNRRTAHKGTMWESVYRDSAVPKEQEDIRTVLAYIHLNPVRAAVTDRFDDYPWSSMTAFRRGDPTAVAGIRLAYEGWNDDSAIAEAHSELMREKLEAEKMRRAMEIARKRASGLAAPCDPLTDEALVTQAAAQLHAIQMEIAKIKEARQAQKNRLKTKSMGESQIGELLEAFGPMDTQMIVARTGLTSRTVYRYLMNLRKSGRIERVPHKFLWRHVAKQDLTSPHGNQTRR